MPAAFGHTARMRPYALLILSQMTTMPNNLPHFADVEAMVTQLRPEEPVYCLRPQVLADLAAKYLTQFPGIVLFAIKANPHELFLQHLYAAGIRHFDTASLNEIALVKNDLPDAHAYYMHPVKGRAAIRSAFEDYDVRHFVIDHIDELEKISETIEGNDPVIIVRLATPSEGAVFELSSKFGADIENTIALLRLARERGYETGLCFHVGSQCTTTRAFRTAFEYTDEVLRAPGVEITHLDIGGGFPSRYVDDDDIPGHDEFMQEIKSGLQRLDLGDECTVMCEPGRALVADGCTLVVQVQLRKGDTLYINDGIYGTLHGVSIGVKLPARLVRPKGKATADHREFTIYGPTCDSLDVFPYTVPLPDDVQEGEWIEFGMLGAYGNALRTEFNGFWPDTFVTIDQAFESTPA